ncbi:MAG: cyclopropane-fatty-acyl-phospholipid synthase family protein [Pseudomonadota bacterium]|nr:cyclopropane-fatty-acyl-phospholipid synthase family protein [Pseudomonadota bacterium]
MPSSPPRTAFLPLLGPVLRRIVQNGRLTIIDWRGGMTSFGEAGRTQGSTIRFHSRWLPLRIAMNPGLAAGEAYMRGDLTIEEGDLRGFLMVATDQREQLRESGLVKLLSGIMKWLKWAIGGNNRRRSVRNVAHHYDLSNEFYRLFLDRNMHYSCAYFPTGNETLEEAQSAKARHIAAKLCLAPGNRVLDIGSGWGSLAMEIAQRVPVHVTGVTLSREQLQGARSRVDQAGLAGAIDFAFQDYRDVAGTFDRIVSVGMLEHVGFAQFQGYFAKVAQLLDRDGVALIHAIGRSDDKGGPDPWTQKYIFPGGHIPSLSEVIPAIERSGLVITDIEILRLHYAETLRHWSLRFAEHRDAARAMYDETFCRMWEFYLAAAEMTFRNRPLMVFQIQLAHRKTAVPLTRDYIGLCEKQAAQTEPEAWGEVA